MAEAHQTKQEAKAPVVKATDKSEFRAVSQGIMEPLGSEAEMRSELGRQERRRQEGAPSWQEEFQAYVRSEPPETVQAARAAAISNLQVDTPAKEGTHIARSHFYFSSQVREAVRRVVLEGFGRVDKCSSLPRISKLVEAIVCFDFDEERLGVKDSMRELTVMLAAEPADDSSERLRSSVLTPADGRLGNPEEVNDIEHMCKQLDEAFAAFAPAVLGNLPAAGRAAAGKSSALGVHGLFKLAKSRHMSVDNIYGVLKAALGQLSSDAWEMRRERGAPPPDIAKRMAEAVTYSLNKRMYHQDMASEVADQLAQREALAGRLHAGVTRQDFSRLESQIQAVCNAAQTQGIVIATGKKSKWDVKPAALPSAQELQLHTSAAAVAASSGLSAANAPPVPGAGTATGAGSALKTQGPGSAVHAPRPEIVGPHNEGATAANPKGGKAHGKVLSAKTAVSAEGVYYADSTSGVRLFFEDRLERAGFGKDMKMRPCPYRALFKDGCTSDARGACRRCNQGSTKYVEHKESTQSTLAAFKSLLMAKSLK